MSARDLTRRVGAEAGCGLVLLEVYSGRGSGGRGPLVISARAVSFQAAESLRAIVSRIRRSGLAREVPSPPVVGRSGPAGNASKRCRSFALQGEMRLDFTAMS